LIIAIVATDFSKHAPPWLRILTIVLLIIAAAFSAFSWASFHWAKVDLERKLEKESVVDVGKWPIGPEIRWTVSLYLFFADGCCLIAVVIFALA
jgi:hypothetical protein